MLHNYLDIFLVWKGINYYIHIFIFVYLTSRKMKNISCFPDPGCYELVKQTHNSTDLYFGNPELGNEPK